MLQLGAWRDELVAWMRRMSTLSSTEVQRSVGRGASFGVGIWQTETATALGLESALRRQGKPNKGKDASRENLT